MTRTKVRPSNITTQPRKPRSKLDIARILSQARIEDPVVYSMNGIVYQMYGLCRRAVQTFNFQGSPFAEYVSFEGAVDILWKNRKDVVWGKAK
jgi:hypothetical protein